MIYQEIHKKINSRTVYFRKMYKNEICGKTKALAKLLDVSKR